KPDELIRAYAAVATGSTRWGLLATNPIEKVFRDRPYRSSFHIAMHVDIARHEYEGAQVLLFAYGEDVTEVDVSVALVDAPAGMTVQVHPVGYGTRPRGQAIPWYHGESSEYWPDALLPNQSFTIAADTVQP